MQINAQIFSQYYKENIIFVPRTNKDASKDILITKSYSKSV